MRKVLCLIFLSVSSLALAQGGARSGSLIKSSAGQAGTVRVCTGAATGTTCSPLATIYSDSALSNPIVGSIVTTDASGNYSYYCSAGAQLKEQSNGVTTPVTCPIDSANFSLKSLYGVLYADKFSGADIGAKINAAYAAAPSTGVRIRISGDSTYTFSTPIVFGTATKPAYLECSPGSWSNGVSVIAPAKLTYTGTGAAVTFQSGVAGGMSGCTLFGPGTGTSTQGLLVQTQNSLFSQNDISNFNVGIQFGSNAYISTFTQNFIHDNGVSGAGNVYAPGSLSSFGENITFNGGSISNKASAFAANCVNLQSGGDFHFNHVSFDQCGMTLNNSGAHVDLSEPHFENPNGASALPFVTLDSSCQWCSLSTTGGYWYENTTGTGRTEFIKEQSSVANVGNQIVINGGTYAPSETVAQLVNSTHACCSSVDIVGGVSNGIGGFQFTNLIGGNWANGYTSNHFGTGTFSTGIVIPVTTGTAPLTIASTTKVTNLNVDQVDGGDWANPLAIGTGTPAAATVTTLVANTSIKAGASGSAISDTRELVQSAHSCGTTTTCVNTANGAARIIYGTVALSSGTPSTAVVSSITAFTSTTSYVCTLTNMTNAANNILKVVNTSTSSFTITGPNTVTDVIAYQCIGN